jgi:hypothetical protein
VAAPQPAGLSARQRALPQLSVHKQRIEPSEIRYRTGGNTRRPAHGHTQPATVSIGHADRLAMRVTSGHPVRTLWVGTFDRADDSGVPLDGGDQFDCLANSACTIETRAGSMNISVPVAKSVRVVVVREVFTLPHGTTLEMVWRFRVSAPSGM